MCNEKYLGAWNASLLSLCHYEVPIPFLFVEHSLAWTVRYAELYPNI